MVSLSRTTQTNCREKSLQRYRQGPLQTLWGRIWKISCTKNEELPMWSSRPARGTDMLPILLRSSREEAIYGATEDFTGSSSEEPITIERRLTKNYGVCSRIPYELCPREDRRRVDPEGKLWCNNVVKWIAYKVRSTLVSTDQRATFSLTIHSSQPNWDENLKRAKVTKCRRYSTPVMKNPRKHFETILD